MFFWLQGAIHLQADKLAKVDVHPTYTPPPPLSVFIQPLKTPPPPLWVDVLCTSPLIV